MYRKRRGSRKFNQAACQTGKQRARMARPLEPRPPVRAGNLERQIIVRDLITGVEHTFNLHVSAERCDSYRVTVDGNVCIPKRMGWTDAVELAGKCFVRVGSLRT